MKNILISVFLVLCSFNAQAALSADAQQLKNKLSKFNEISAQFVQRVMSPEGKLLNESRGELAISRPGKFNWQVNQPEPESIISDGKTIWYYSPFIEQVTLINFSDAVNGTPFVLLAGADETQWSSYQVKQQNNQFTVTHLDPQVAATTFIFSFDEKSNISQFVVIEAQGQRSEFTLTQKVVKGSFEQTLFHFDIPQGVEVDDQR